MSNPIKICVDTATSIYKSCNSPQILQKVILFEKEPMIKDSTT